MSVGSDVHMLGMHISEALKRFLVQLQADGRSPCTRAQYERHVAALQRWLSAEGHGDDVRTIGHEQLANFLVAPAARARPDGKPKKATSVNALRTSLRCFFGYLANAGVVDRDPARMVRRARGTPAPPRTLSEDEVRRLRETLSQAQGREAQRDRVLINLMLGCGVRIGSTVGLDLDDIDHAQRELRVRTTKGDRAFTLPIPESLRPMLAEFIDGRRGGPLFTRVDGQRLSIRQVQRRVTSWLRKAGITRRASPHSFRHTFASALLKKTGNVALVSRALNHASVASTAVYLRVGDDELRAALA